MTLSLEADGQLERGEARLALLDGEARLEAVVDPNAAEEAAALGVVFAAGVAAGVAGLRLAVAQGEADVLCDLADEGGAVLRMDKVDEAARHPHVLRIA